MVRNFEVEITQDGGEIMVKPLRKEKVSRVPWSILKDNTIRQLSQNKSTAHEENILINIRSTYRN